MGFGLASILAKGGAILSKNPELVVNAGLGIWDRIRGKRKNEEEEIQQATFEAQNENFESALLDIETSILELQKAFEASAAYFESQNDSMATEIQAIKDNHEKTISNLQYQIAQYKNENMAFKEEIKKQLMIISIAAGVGIVLAIILAIAL